MTKPIPGPMLPRTYLETSRGAALSTAAALSQNAHYLMSPNDEQMLFAPMTVTTAAVWNGATANGNFAVDIWYSTDLLTATKLGTTGSVAQSGTAAIQTAPLTATVTIPAGVYVFIGFSLDSATGTYLRQAAVGAAINALKAQFTTTAASFNPAGPITLNTNGGQITPWVKVY